MNINKDYYKKYAKKRASSSPVIKDTSIAFAVGGFLSAFAELLFKLYVYVGIENEIVKTLVPVTFIFIAGLLTGIGVFDDIARFSGAGTLVPITGFANSIVAAAIDDKSEGFIMGVGAKMFVIAGPVIVYGTLSSAVYGIIYYFFQGVF